MGSRIRLIALGVFAILVVVVSLQNTEAVETRILLATVTMPRVVLLLTTTLVGFVAGVLTALVWTRKREPKADGRGAGRGVDTESGGERSD